MLVAQAQENKDGYNSPASPIEFMGLSSSFPRISRQRDLAEVPTWNKIDPGMEHEVTALTTLFKDLEKTIVHGMT